MAHNSGQPKEHLQSPIMEVPPEMAKEQKMQDCQERTNRPLESSGRK